MPYYHVKCNGEIALWRRRCKKCGHHWPISVLFTYPPPPDMRYEAKRRTMRGKTSYAKWADKGPPGAALFASRLPGWPRWVRILVVAMLVLIAAFFIYFIWGLYT